MVDRSLSSAAAIAVVVTGLGLPACSCSGARDQAGMPDSSDDDGAIDAGLAKIVINEVVLSPMHDWSDTAGTPFDAVPGHGAVTSVDEYVELTNLGGVPIDLTGWVLEIRDSEPSTTTLGTDGVIVTSAGSTLTALAPGGFLVIGDPVGLASTDAYVVLRTPDGQMIDDVEIGGLTAARDTEGDGVGDGAPDAMHNGFARGSFDEAIARRYGAADTDNDQADFVAMRATPLAPNVPAIPIDDGQLPRVTGRTIATALRVTDPIEIALSEPIDITTLDRDGNLTVTVGGVPIALGFHTLVHDDATIVINPIGRLPFDSDLQVTLKGGAGAVSDLAGNPLAADVVFTVHTEGAPANPAPVRLNELCLSPRQDWSDSHGAMGVPYDGTPGDGVVDSADQWVELLDELPGTTDLSNYRLVVYAGPTLLVPARSQTLLSASGSTIRVVGAGTSIASVAQGDRIIIGNPAGTFTPNVWVELRDGDGKLVDMVEVGGNTPATDRGGDGVSNGAPGAGQDGSSTGLADEVVARVPDGQDTGDNPADWDHAAGTPGAAN